MRQQQRLPRALAAHVHVVYKAAPGGRGARVPQARARREHDGAAALGPALRQRLVDVAHGVDDEVRAADAFG